MEPQQRRVRLERFGDRLELRCHSPERAGGCFLVLWLTGWTVGCVFLAGAVLRAQQLFLLVFAVPFWASWFFVFFLLLKMFFQREHFVLDRGGAEFVQRVILPIAKRFVPMEEIRGFEVYSTVVDSESNRTASGIELLTMGRSLRFAEGVSSVECDWLAYQLNDHLGQLRVPRAGGTGGLGDQAGTATANEGAVQLWPGETVTAAPWPMEPPSDSRWTRADGFDEFTFAQRGRLSWTAAGLLLFVNLFWNGIVSVFVMVLAGLAPGEQGMQGAAWWGLFFFLIPFEAIGLAMFLGLLAVLLEPLRRTSWTFTRQSIERRSKWLGIGPTRTWWVRQLDRLQLCREEPPSRASLGSLSGLPAGTGDGSPVCRLVLIDKENREFCSLRGLTLGEARWIADTVLRERAAWFA